MLDLMPRILHGMATSNAKCYATAEFMALADLLRLHRLRQTVAPFITPGALKCYANHLTRVTLIGTPPHNYWPGYSSEECLVLIALVLLGLDGMEAAECFHMLSARPLPGIKNRLVML